MTEITSRHFSMLVAAVLRKASFCSAFLCASVVKSFGAGMRPEGTMLPVLLAGALLCAFPALADESEDLKSLIVMRCLYHAGEFGNELVDICVKADLAAAQALQEYPPQSAEIVQRCTARLLDGGWEKIRICADNDIAAEEALARLDPRHGSLIAECRAKAGRYGSAGALVCVQDALKPGG